MLSRSKISVIRERIYFSAIREKVRSILYLTLGAEGKRVFAKKHPRVKVLGISFKKFYELLESAFIKPTNITFERYKLLSRKQKDRIFYHNFGAHYHI